jgi:hypothetical protein
MKTRRTENAVQKVVRLVGGVTKAAIIAQVTPNSVYIWMEKGVVTKTASAVLLARATKNVVTVDELAGLERE